MYHEEGAEGAMLRASQASARDEYMMRKQASKKIDCTVHVVYFISSFIITIQLQTVTLL